MVCGSSRAVAAVVCLLGLLGSLWLTLRGQDGPVHLKDDSEAREPVSGLPPSTCIGDLISCAREAGELTDEERRVLLGEARPRHAQGTTDAGQGRALSSLQRRLLTAFTAITVADRLGQPGGGRGNDAAQRALGTSRLAARLMAEPRLTERLLSKSTAYFQNRRLEAARTMAERLAEAAPMAGEDVGPVARFLAVSSGVTLGETGPAREAMQGLASASSGLSPAALFMLGNSYLWHREYDRAYATFARVAAEFPDAPCHQAAAGMAERLKRFAPPPERQARGAEGRGQQIGPRPVLETGPQPGQDGASHSR